MTDLKYENLIGLAPANEPDTYEVYTGNQEENARLSSRSDRVTDQLAGDEEWCVASESDKCVTPHQQYNDLRIQVDRFESDLLALTHTASHSDERSLPSNHDYMLSPSNTNLLRSQLYALQICNRSFQPSHCDVAYKALNCVVSSGQDAVSYSLNVSKGSTTDNSLTILSEMDSRISFLETLIGINQSHSCLGVHSSVDGVQAGVEWLKSVLTAVGDNSTASSLSRLKMALSQLYQKLNEIYEAFNSNQELKHTLEAFSQELVCQEMFTLSDCTQQQIHLVLSRLQSVKHVHDKSVLFEQVLSHVEQTRRDITTLLDQCEALYERACDSCQAMFLLLENCALSDT